MFYLVLITIPLNFVIGMWLATQLGWGPSSLNEYRYALGLAEMPTEEINDENLSDQDDSAADEDENEQVEE